MPFCIGMSVTHQPCRDSEYTSISAGTCAAANDSFNWSFASGCCLSSFEAIPKYIRPLIFDASRCGLSGFLVTRPPPWNEPPAPTRSDTAAQVFTTSGPPMQYPCVPIFFDLLTDFCLSSHSTYAVASFSQLPDALMEPINGPSLARCSGF